MLFLYISPACSRCIRPYYRQTPLKIIKIQCHKTAGERLGIQSLQLAKRLVLTRRRPQLYLGNRIKNQGHGDF